MSSGDIISGKYFDVIKLRGNTVVNIVEACMNGFYCYLSNVPPILSELFLDWLDIPNIDRGFITIIEDGRRSFKL